MINKFGYAFNNQDSMDLNLNTVGSFVYNFANQLGLGANIYQDWEPTNDAQMPPGGWKRGENGHKMNSTNSNANSRSFWYEPVQTEVTSVSMVFETKIDGTEKEEFNTLPLDTWSYVIDFPRLADRDYVTTKSRRSGWEDTCEVGQNPWEFYIDTTPYVETHLDAGCGYGPWDGVSQI